MRYETKTVRVGERVGDIDWSYDFLSHFSNYCTNDAGKADLCEESIATLKTIAERHSKNLKTLITTDGGWPKFGWGEVLDVGMYDGWPYWKPVPSVLVKGPLGPEWKHFCSITGFEEINP